MTTPIPMKNFKTIFSKEFKTYFLSPVAYFVIIAFLIWSGVYFFSTFFYYNQAELRIFFSFLPTIFALLIPAVTMRLFSEEMHVGSYEILATLPVKFQDIILGKLAAAVAFIGVMLSPTIVYAVSVAFMGELDWGPVIGGYIGSIFLGAAYASIGIFASALSKNQIVALIIGVFICFFLAILDTMLFFLPREMLGFFQYLSANYHFQNIAKGVIDSRDIIYFISVSFVALYAAHLTMQEKK